MKKLVSLFLSIFIFAISAFANLYFVGSTDKDPLSYKVGEEMKFEIQLFDKNDNPVIGQSLVWSIDSDDASLTRYGKSVSSKEPLKLSAKINKAGFVRVRVFALDKDGKCIPLRHNEFVSFQGGAGADVESIKHSKIEPSDFDEFWQRQLGELARVPLNGEKKFHPDLSKGEFDIYELTVDSIGKPAKAWLSIPKGAKDKSLGIDVSLYGYGVSREYPYSPKGAIGLRVARHSCELSREPKYYEELKNGKLKHFGFNMAENRNPENCYFKFMLLRDFRGLDWVKKNVSQWDGKNIVVSGESMGGFRSIFLAYLDKDVKICRPNVPWMTDLYAYVDTTRQPNESHREWIGTLRYFDSVFAAKRVECPMYITAWLGDYVCPPAGVMVLFNNANKLSTIDFGQNGTHSGALSKPEKSIHSKINKNNSHFLFDWF